MSSYLIESATDPNDLACRAAQIIASYIDLSLDQRERSQIALSGGSTPAQAYSLLGMEHLPWERVDVLLGDERWVDLTDPASNARMIRETLLAGTYGSKASFHPISTLQYPTPEKSAEAFSNQIQKICLGHPPVFDLIVLGLGDDGHTASLFPGTAALSIKDQLATVGMGKGLNRITLTVPVLCAARKVLFLVSGSKKANALKRLLDPNESPRRTPARLVQPREEILVIADEGALASL